MTVTASSWQEGREMLEAGLEGVVERLGAWHWVQVSSAGRAQRADLLILAILLFHLLINRSRWKSAILSNYIFCSCIYSFRGIACKLFCLKWGHMPIIHRSYHCRIGSLYFLNSDSSVEQKSSLELRSKNLLLQKQQLFPPTFEMILWPYSNENTHDKLLQVSRLVLM